MTALAPSKLTAFRLYIATLCQEATGITINPGMFSGPIQGADIGCCWPIGKRANPANKTEEFLEVRVRLFLNVQDNDGSDPENGHDPTELEQLIDTCQLAASSDDPDDNRAGGSVWMFELTEGEVNMAQYGVEMAFVARGWNQFHLVSPTDDGT